MFSKLRIKTKMMLVLCSVMLLMYGITIFLGMRSTNAAIEKEAIERTRNLAFYYGERVKARLGKGMQTAQVIAQTYQGMILSRAKPNQASLTASLKQIFESDPDLSGMWVMLDPGFFPYPYAPYFYRENGNTISIVETGMEYYTSQQAEDYYSIPRQQKKNILIEPYIDPDRNVLMSSAVAPIMVNGKFMGVVGVDMTMDALYHMLSKVRPYETGMASLISNSGKYIAHTGNSMVNTSFEKNNSLFKDIVSAAVRGEEFSFRGFSKALQKETWRIFVPVQIGAKEHSWFFSVEVPLDKILESGREILYVTLIAGGVAIIIVACLIFLIAGYITSFINRIVSGFKEIAQGDLSVRLDITSKDELGELASWFNVFMEKIHDIIAKINEETNQVDGASQGLSGLAAELSSHITSTSERTDNVADAAEQLNTNVTAIAAAMEESTTNTSMVASASGEMSATISQIAKNVEEASEISDSAVTQARETSLRMGELEETAQAISRVTETITDISDKTNLLALNATIEAARAGEAGKGFAVVATEIKELAAQTIQATEDIKNQINSIQDSSRISISSIDGIVKIINKINEIIKTITTAVEEQSTATQEITINITQASQGLAEINENVNQSASISGEISRDIGQVSEAAGQIAGKSSEATEQAAQLKELSSTLKEMVNSFKI